VRTTKYCGESEHAFFALSIKYLALSKLEKLISFAAIGTPFAIHQRGKANAQNLSYQVVW
jgi:hypothetical protein